MTLRHDGKLRHLGIRKIHGRKKVVMLIDTEEVTVLDLQSSEILRPAQIGPGRSYWLDNQKSPGRWPGDPDQNFAKDVMTHLSTMSRLFTIVEAIQQLSRMAYHYRQLMSPLNQKAKNYRKRSDRSPQPKRVHKIKYRLTEAQIQDVLRRYEAGEASAAVGKVFGISKTTVISLLNEHGITIRGHGLTDQQKKQASRLRQSGFTIKEIAQQIGSKYSATQRYIASVVSAD